MSDNEKNPYQSPEQRPTEPIVDEPRQTNRAFSDDRDEIDGLNPSDTEMPSLGRIILGIIKLSALPLIFFLVRYYSHLAQRQR